MDYYPNSISVVLSDKNLNFHTRIRRRILLLYELFCIVKRNTSNFFFFFNIIPSSVLSQKNSFPVEIH